VDCASTHAILAGMAEDQDDNQQIDDEEGAGEPASTPFDNPFFLPVLLWAFAAWFGYDIVTNAEAYQNFPLFNQIGCAVFSLLALYFTRSAIKERNERERTPD
jgi:hypothetical protein